LQRRELGKCVIEPGSALLVCSDGIPECRVGETCYMDRRFPEFVRRTERTLEGQSAASIGKSLLADVDAFRGEAPVQDDLTLLVVKRAPG
jgi:serine phosphatase RsbU (regulator of sigma subunit)